MKEKTIREILSSLFVPRAKDMEGVAFRLEYMQKENAAYPVYKIVSDAQHNSNLSFDFSYAIANIAVDVLIDCDDWSNDDELTRFIDSSLPVYTGSIMEIYVSDSSMVYEATEEMGDNSQNSEQRALFGWYKAINEMVYSIKGELEKLIKE